MNDMNDIGGYLGSMVKKALRRREQEQGFTMIELLLSIFILSIIMAGMLVFLWGASQHWQTGQNIADINENARLGLNRMTREIKQSSQITEALAEQLQFDANLDGYEETITYGFAAGDSGEPGTVWRESSQQPGQRSTVMEKVASITFEYFGNDYRCDLNPADGKVTYDEIMNCEIGTLTSIARVDIVLAMRADSSPSHVFLGQAWLRNRVVE